MNILYDFEIFSRQRYGGISRYFYELIRGICGLKDININLYLGFNNSGYEFERLTGSISVSGKKVPYADNFHFLFHALNAANFNAYVRKIGSRLFHKTYYSQVGMNLTCKKIMTVHDMTHELYPQFFVNTNRTSSQKKNCI